MPNGDSDRGDATGLVLCGGQGRRLGGVDKGLLEVAGKPLIEHVLDRLRRQVDTIIISANRNRDRYAAYGYDVVSDPTADYEGPLAGVLSGLRACSSLWMVTVPCDAPGVPEDIVSRLVSHAVEHDAEAACARDRERLQPTFCAYRAGLADSLEQYLAAGGRKIDRYLESRRWVSVEFENGEAAFANLNTDQEVAAFEGRDHEPEKSV